MRKMDDKLEKPITSPKDFFLNLLSIAALYTSAGSFVALIFQYINILFPDILEFGGYGDHSRVAYNVIRFAISALVVSFPLYLGTIWFMNKDYRISPEKRDLRIRRWLIYFTLFAATVIIMGDLIALINTLLIGGLTTRFILQVITIFAVAGAIFAYYLFDLRKYKTE